MIGISNDQRVQLRFDPCRQFANVVRPEHQSFDDDGERRKRFYADCGVDFRQPEKKMGDFAP